MKNILAAKTSFMTFQRQFHFRKQKLQKKVLKQKKNLSEKTFLSEKHFLPISNIGNADRVTQHIFFISS
jgi:hypothetical protein